MKSLLMASLVFAVTAHAQPVIPLEDQADIGITENPGAAATAEEALAAFKDHRLDPSALTSESGKEMAAEWESTQENLMKDGEENQKRREILGRLFLISKADKGNILKSYIDVFSVAYGEKIDPAKSDAIVENVWSLADQHEGTREGAVLNQISTQLQEREFGSVSAAPRDRRMSELADKVVSYSLGDESKKPDLKE